ADDASRRDSVARADRGPALRLGRIGREQRGRGVHPRTAPQAGARTDPERAGGRLLRSEARDAGRRMTGSSIRTRLLLSLLPLFILAEAVIGTVTYRYVLRDSHELFDYHLRQM